MKMEAIPRNFDNHEWITFILAISLVVIAWVKTRHTDKFYYFVRLLSSGKYFTESQKAIKSFERFNYGLFIPRALFLSLGLYFLCLQLGIQTEPGLVSFSKILLLYFVFIIGKFLVEKILGVLFSMEELLNKYSFFKFTAHNFTGFLLLPILLILSYTWSGSELFYKIGIFGFLGINLLFLYHYYQKNENIIFGNLFYFILYLCTFEIAPYFILYKAIN